MKREFLNIIEALIDSPVDLQDAIQRYMYQDFIQYARSQLNFVVGEGLYLLPSDMNLRIGTYARYNILITTSDLYTRIKSSHEFRVSTTIYRRSIA